MPRDQLISSETAWYAWMVPGPGMDRTSTRSISSGWRRPNNCDLSFGPGFDSHRPLGDVLPAQLDHVKVFTAF